MADPFYTLNMPSASNAHKRSYDDIAPEPDAGGSAPSGSRGESIDSPDDTSNSRERNKRPRNETTDSSYTSEVEDILLPSNTSVSSSSSGSSYHSARSAFTAASPPLLEVEEVLEDDPSDPVLHSPEPFASDSLPPTWEDTLSMMSGPIQISSPPPARPAEVPDSEEQFRRTMERVDAFDREMSALRQSPFRPSDPTDWALWNDPLLSSSGSAFSSFPRVPDPHPTVSEPPATGARAAHRALHATDRLQPTSSSMLHDDPLSNVPRVNLPRVLPRVPGLAMGSRFSQLERDAARYGDTVGRGRAREGTTISLHYMHAKLVHQQTFWIDCWASSPLDHRHSLRSVHRSILLVVLHSAVPM
ncbi:hypothetical protein L226DRAFT_250745 [Lentinus tigrinus ALCF2SS1-7]|uniref:uncharacterized protein n=1 Tax=Lentinus tigrinus ALCF2SS1-7 TaxID=1328758 RepID=UPI001165CCB0|nr:hypothetical protein L226DRAFT_250745 [Lentinus tigrinus ALCF2SS1-7]